MTKIVHEMAPISSIKGEITLPGSKSLTNRLLLLSALAKGSTRLTNLLLSEDTEHMLTALSALGVNHALSPADKICTIHGLGGRFPPSNNTRALFLGNAGTAIRPLTAALSLTQSEFIIDGDEAMRERPIGPLVDALKALGIGIQYTGEAGFPPLKLQGGAFSHSITTLDGSLSSQYLTALLMALPLAPQDTTVRIEGDLVSLPYIDMTLAVLDRFGIEIEHDDYRLFRIRGGQMLDSPGQVLVEGDASSASYFLAAAAISGEVTVKGVGTASLQGDVAFADVVEAMGAHVARQADQISVRASGSLKAIDVDLNHIPDAAMTLATLALFAEGTTRIRNIYNWRIKETDRMTAMATELRKVGATITTTEDSITITPPAELKSAQIATYGDHRMAMCFSLLAMSSAPPVIENPEVTAKTFPNYWEALASVSH